MRIIFARPGDTLWKIALRYNTTLEEILKLNSNIKNPDLIMPGDPINVPESACPPLKRGDTDATTNGAVSTLQALLNAKFSAGLVVDGFFGPVTENAVKNFQSANGIPATGVVDTRTWTALGMTCVLPPTTTTQPPTTTTQPPATTTQPPTSTPPPTTLPPTSPPGFNCPLLGFGSRGDNVKFLQYMLNALGFNAGAVDGIFGPQTLGALENFQRTNGLTITGTTTTSTWQGMGIFCPTATPFPTTTQPPTTTPTPTSTPLPTPTPPPSFNCPVLGLYSSGENVVFLQMLLNAFGFNAGNADGIFGPHTLTALLSFQTKNNLQVTGTTTFETWAALGVSCPATTTPVPTATPTATPTPSAIESLWFYVNTPDALADFTQHYPLISVLIPFWYGVTASGDIQSSQDPNVLSFAKTNSVPIYGLIHNFNGSIFDPQLIATILADSGLRSRLISNILFLVSNSGLAGVNIDFEFVPPDQRTNLTTFMSELYQVLHSAGYVVTMDVPAKESDDPTNRYSGAFDYANLAKYVEEMIILTQDEHYVGIANPGPIASAPWVQRVLDYAITQAPASKIKISIPAYAYDWPQGKTGNVLSVPGAVQLAQSANAQIQWDKTSLEPFFNYTTSTGEAHQVWFENSISTAVKIDIVQKYGLAGFAVWRLGQEDPDVWNVINTYI